MGVLGGDGAEGARAVAREPEDGHARYLRSSYARFLRAEPLSATLGAAEVAEDAADGVCCTSKPGVSSATSVTLDGVSNAPHLAQ